MANGDITHLDRHVWAATLLDAQQTASDGVWVELPPHTPHVSIDSTTLEEGTTDATVAIHASNASAKPANNTDGVVINTQTGGNVNYTASVGWRWIKAKKTAGTTPVATTVRARARAD